MAELGDPQEFAVGTQPVAQPARVFISYASRDGAVAEKVRGALEGAGLPCWMAPRDVRPGESYAAAIVDAISACPLLVLVLSKSAIESSHVLREVERASSKNRPVLAVRLDTTELPSEFEYFLSATQWLDASAGRVEQILPALIESVRGRSSVNTSGSAGPSPAISRAVARGADTPAPHSSEHDHGLPFKIPFLEQLKHRHVGRVAILYGVLCYLILEPFSMFLHVLALPEWTGRALVTLMVLGFPAVLICSWIFELTPRGIKSATGVDSTQSRRKLAGRRLDFAIIILLTLALGYFAADKFWFTKRLLTPERPTTAATAVVNDKSIAVLPFTDMSEKKDQEYFGDGMAEEILDLLTRIPGLTVIGRTSSFQFKGRNEDLRTIGARLNAAYVLEGSVRKSGEHVRITAQLINTQTGGHEWSETYDRPIGDVLTLQDAIAAAVVRELQLTVDFGDQQARSAPKNPEVYDLILRGRHAADHWDKEGFDEAVMMFQQALDRDSTSAEAAVGLALAYLWQGEWGFMAPSTAFEQARRAATMALQLNPKMAEAHGVLGNIHVVYDWDWVAAELEFHQESALAPGSASALHHNAFLAFALGRWDDAFRQINAALARDPLSGDALSVLCWIQTRRGHLPEAELAMRRALDIRPNFAWSHYYIALLMLERGDRNGALVEAQKAADDAEKRLSLAMVYYALGRKADSDAALAHMLHKDADVNAFGIAEVYGFRGEPDEAMLWLERAYLQKDPSLFYIKGELPLKNLEVDPRYKAFLRKMKLPDESP